MQAETRAEDPSPSLMGSILKKAASLLGARVLGNLLTLGYTILLARLVTPTEFGLVMAGFSWAMLLSVGLALNVESGSIRFLVNYNQNRQTSLAAGFIRFNRTLILAISVTCILSFVTLCYSGILDYTDQRVKIFAIALVAAPIVALTRVYARHATALGQVLRGGVPIMLARPAVICGFVGIIWLSGAEFSPVQLLLTILAAFVVTALLQAYLLRNSFSFTANAQATYSDYHQWLETGVMMAPLLLLRDNLKHVIVASAGLVLAIENVGQVALALSIMSLLYFAVKAVDISLSPQLSKALQAGQRGRVQHLIAVSAKIKLAVLVCGVVGILLAGKWILALFGSDYAMAYIPLLATMLIPAADGLFGPAQIVLNVSGQQKYVFGAAGLGTLLLISLTALAAWLGGAVGAAAGAGLAYCIQQFVLCLLSNRVAGIETSALSLIRRQTTDT